MVYRLLLLVFLGCLCWTPAVSRVIQKRAAFYIANETMCIVDGEVYRNGDPVPTDDECERCTCRPPGFSCVLRDCDTKPGCKAVRRAGECCPEYVCGCVHNNRLYEDGELIKDLQNNCYTCRCHGSSISCTFADCLFRGDCPPEYIPGECCPRYDHCPPLSTTTTTTTPIIQQEIEFVNLTTQHLEKFTSEGTTVTIQDITSSESASTTPSYETAEDTLFTVKFTLTSEKFSSIHDYDVTELTTVLPLQTVDYQETTKHVISPSGTLLTTLKDGLIFEDTDETTTEDVTHSTTVSDATAAETETEYSTSESSTSHPTDHDIAVSELESTTQVSESSAEDSSSTLKSQDVTQGATVPVTQTSETDSSHVEEKEETTFSDATTSSSGTFSQISTIKQSDDTESLDFITSGGINVENETTNQPPMTVSDYVTSDSAEEELHEEMNKIHPVVIHSTQTSSTEYIDVSTETTLPGIASSEAHTDSEKDDESKSEKTTQKTSDSTYDELHSSSQDIHTYTLLPEDSEATKFDSDDLHSGTEDNETSTSESVTTKELVKTKISETDLPENEFAAEHEAETSTISSETPTPLDRFSTLADEKESATSLNHQTETSDVSSHDEEYGKVELATTTEESQTANDFKETSSLFSTDLETTSDQFTEGAKVVDSENLETTTDHAESPETSQDHGLSEFSSQTTSSLEEITKFSKTSTATFSDLDATSEDYETTLNAQTIDVSTSEDGSTTIEDLVELDSAVDDSHALYHHTETTATPFTTHNLSQTSSYHEHTETEEESSGDSAPSSLSTTSDEEHDLGVEISSTISDASTNARHETLSTQPSTSHELDGETTVSSYSEPTTMEDIKSSTTFEKPVTESELLTSDIFTHFETFSGDSSPPLYESETQTVSETEYISTGGTSHDIESSKDSAETELNEFPSSSSTIPDATDVSSYHSIKGYTDKSYTENLDTTTSDGESSLGSEINIYSKTSFDEETGDSDNSASIHTSESETEGIAKHDHEKDDHTTQTETAIIPVKESTDSETHVSSLISAEVGSGYTSDLTLPSASTERTYSETSVDDESITHHTLDSEITSEENTDLSPSETISASSHEESSQEEQTSVTAEDLASTLTTIINEEENEVKVDAKETYIPEEESLSSTAEHYSFESTTADETELITGETAIDTVHVLKENESISLKETVMNTEAPTKLDNDKSTSSSEEVTEPELLHVKHNAEHFAPYNIVTDSPKSIEITSFKPVTQKTSTAYESSMPNELPAFEPPLANIFKQPMIFTKPTAVKDKNLTLLLPADTEELKNNITEDKSEENDLLRLSLSLAEEDNETAVNISSTNVYNSTDDISNIFVLHHEYTIPDSEVNDIDVLDAEEIDDSEDPIHKFSTDHETITVTDDTSSIDSHNSETTSSEFSRTDQTTKGVEITEENGSLTTIISDVDKLPETYTEEKLQEKHEDEEDKKHLLVSSLNANLLTDSDDDHKSPILVKTQNVQDILPSKLETDSTEQTSSTQESIEYSTKNSVLIHKNHNQLQNTKAGISTTENSGITTMPSETKFYSEGQTASTDSQQGNEEAITDVESHTSSLPQHETSKFHESSDFEDESTFIADAEEMEDTTEVSTTSSDHVSNIPDAERISGSTTEKEVESTKFESTSEEPLRENPTTSDIEGSAETQHETFDLHQNLNEMDLTHQVSESTAVSEDNSEMSTINVKHENNLPPDFLSVLQDISSSLNSDIHDSSETVITDTERYTSTTPQNKDSDLISTVKINVLFGQNVPDIPIRHEMHTTNIPKNDEEDNLEAENFHPNNDDVIEFNEIKNNLNNSSETTTSDLTSHIYITQDANNFTEAETLMSSTTSFNENTEYQETNAGSNNSLVSIHNLDETDSPDETQEAEAFEPSNETVSSEGTQEAETFEPSDETVNSEEIREAEASATAEETVNSEEIQEAEASATAEETVSPTKYVEEDATLGHTLSHFENESTTKNISSDEESVSVPQDTTSPFTILEYLGDLFSGLSTFSTSLDTNNDTTTQVNFAQTNNDQTLDESENIPEENESTISDSVTSNESYKNFLKNQFAEYGSLGGVFITGQSKYNGSTIGRQKHQQDNETLNATLSEDTLFDNDAKSNDSINNNETIVHNAGDTTDDDMENSEEDENFSAEESKLTENAEHQTSTFSTKRYFTYETLVNNNENQETSNDEITLNSEELPQSKSSDETNSTEESSVDSDLEKHNINDYTDFKTEEPLSKISAYTDTTLSTLFPHTSEETPKSDSPIKTDIGEAYGPEKGGEWFEPDSEPKFPSAHSASDESTSNVTPLSDITESGASVANEDDANSGPEKGGEVFEPTFPDVLPIHSINSEIKNDVNDSDKNDGPEKGGEIFEPSFPEVFPISSVISESTNDTDPNNNTSDAVTENVSETKSNTVTSSYAEEEASSTESSEIKSVSKATDVISDSSRISGNVPPLPLLMKTFNNHMPRNSDQNVQESSIQDNSNTEISSSNSKEQHVNVLHERVSSPKKVKNSRSIDDPYHLSYVISRGLKAENPGTLLNEDNQQSVKESYLKLSNFEIDQSVPYPRYVRSAESHSFQTSAFFGRPLKQISQMKDGNTSRQRRDTTNYKEEQPVKTEDDSYVLASNNPPKASDNTFPDYSKHILLVEGFGRKPDGFHPVTSSFIIVHSDEENETEERQKSKPPGVDAVGNISEIEFLDDRSSDNVGKRDKASDSKKGLPEK